MMSKIVKGVANVVKGVVKGAVKVVKSVAKGVGGIVKKIASSPIGRALLMAATVYFGGAAIMGAMGGVGATASGSGFLANAAAAFQGAGAGIASAWNGLVGAGSALMGGQGLSAAGSSLSSGFMGANAAGQAAVSGATAGSGLVQGAITNGMTQSQMLAAQNAGIPGATQATQVALRGALPAAAPAAGSGGWVSSMWNGLGEYGKHAAITGGMQLAGGLIQGYGAQKQQESLWDREDSLSQAERDRREANMSARFNFGEAGDSTYTPTGQSENFTNPGQNMSGGPAYLRNGLLGGAMLPPTAYSTLNQFPVYNPAMGRY
jgi:hypothetical protein